LTHRLLIPLLVFLPLSLPTHAARGDRFDSRAAIRLCEVARSAASATPPAAARSAAQKSIAVLQALEQSSPEMACQLMFLCREEPPAPIELGERPLIVARLASAKVRKRVARARKELTNKLEESEQYVFPIQVDIEGFGSIPISTVTVTWDGEAWEVSSIGRRHLVTSLFRTWLPIQARDDDNAQVASQFLIDMHGPFANYLATCEGQELSFVSLFGDKPAGEFNLEAEWGKLFTDVYKIPRGLSISASRTMLKRLGGQQSLKSVLKELKNLSRNYVSPLSEDSD